MAFSDFVSVFLPFQTPSPALCSLLSPYLNLSPIVPLFSLHTTHALPLLLLMPYAAQHLFHQDPASVSWHRRLAQDLATYLFRRQSPDLLRKGLSVASQSVYPFHPDPETSRVFLVLKIQTSKRISSLSQARWAEGQVICIELGALTVFCLIGRVSCDS